jgi:hypothetical protein
VDSDGDGVERDGDGDNVESDGDGVLRSGRQQRVEEWTATTLRGTETVTALRGTKMATTLRGTATATALQKGWQKKNVGLQKPKGLGERRMERENTMDYFFFRKYACIFEGFFFNFRFF